MEHIPDGILKNVAQYLPPSDALRLNCISKRLNTQLSLSVTDRTILNNVSGYDQISTHGPYQMVYGFKIPVPAAPCCHSVHISMSWMDQGWGNTKSYVVICGDKGDATDEDDQLVVSRTVDSSDIAPHTQEHLSFTFVPKIDETYHLQYVVGGGGGHSLSLSDITVRTLVFDDPSRCYKRAFDFLARNDAFRPWDDVDSRQSNSACFPSPLETILASAKYLLQRGGPILPPIVEFFRLCGIREGELSQKFFDWVESILVELSLESAIYRGDEQRESNDDTEHELIAPSIELPNLFGFYGYVYDDADVIAEPV